MFKKSLLLLSNLALAASLCGCPVEEGTSTSSSSGSSGSTGGFGAILAHPHVDQAEDLTVVGNYAYVCGKDHGLAVFDVSAPAAPVAKPIVSDAAWDVVADSGKLYVADNEGTLRIYDIAAHPDAPAKLGEYAPGWNVIQVAVSGTKAYVSGGDGSNGKFDIVDVSNPAAPARLGGLSFTGANNLAGSSLVLKGTVAYYGDAAGALRILDVSDAAHPAELQKLTTDGTAGHSPWALGLFVDGNLLYLSDWGAGVQIFDVTDPKHPVLKSVFNTGGFAFYDVWASGNRAYVACDGGVAVLDVSDPANPKLIGDDYISLTFNLNDGPHGIWVKEKVGYVADNKESSLTVFSVAE